MMRWFRKSPEDDTGRPSTDQLLDDLGDHLTAIERATAQLSAVAERLEVRRQREGALTHGG